MEKGKGHGTLRRERQQSSLLHHQGTMTVPYAAAGKWVRIRSSISAVTFDVENREKRGNNNKEKGIS
jgi:hypothetical protein